MASDSNHPPVGYPDPALPDAEEAWRLTDAMLAGNLAAEGERQLMQLVVDQPAMARLYLRAVHEWCTIPVHRGLVESPETLLGSANEDPTRDALVETMIVPAVRDASPGEPTASDSEIFRPAATDPWRRSVPARTPYWTPLRIGAWSGAAAAVLALGGVAVWSLRPAPSRIASNGSPAVQHAPVVAPVVPERPPAVLSGLAGAMFEAGSSFKPGTPLYTGDAIHLVSGAIELTFDRGAVVVVKAPAAFRVVNRDLLALDDGSLAAHVPPGAVGFRVDAPGLAAIDRGTDFGVRTTTTGAGSELVVFTGAVDALAGNAASATAPAEAPAVRVVAGHSVAHTAGDGSPPHEVRYAPAEFVRSIESYRTNIPLNGTGVQLPDGQPDPNWQAVADPSGRFAVPRQAYAITMSKGGYVLPSPEVKWLTNAPKVTVVGEGNFTFRTTVKLPEFAPGTLSIGASWGADDWISDVLVNGKSTAGENASAVGQQHSRMNPVSWRLDGAPWRKGDNQVDVVVWNQTSPKAPRSFMGFVWSWAASYSPVVYRPGAATPP